MDNAEKKSLVPDSRDLGKIVAAFAGKRVLIVGDVMLDEYVWGEVRRISPEAPVPVVEMRRRTYVPGGAANTAANVLSLNGKASLGGVVGRDSQGDKLVEILSQVGVDADGIGIDPERQTSTKTRVIAHNQQVVRVDSEQRLPLRRALEQELLDWVRKALPRADACVLSDYGKGVVSSAVAEGVIGLARQADKPVILDPKGTDYAKYRNATLIKPNLAEAERFCNLEINSAARLAEVGQRILETCLLGALLITRGADGMTLFCPGKPPEHIPSFARAVFDVTGAGDTVASTLALALAARASVEQAARLANKAAGVVVGKVGTATVTREELLAVVS
jgi:D-beta-D-heptose 7-phosphate kinase/D-beta-D-heptose 1-phosphate adenosyltransferase